LETAVVKYRLRGKMYVKLNDVGAQRSHPEPLTKRKRSGEFTAEVRIDVDAAMAKSSQGFHKLLRALHGAVPVHHRQNDDVRQMILAGKECLRGWT
jgi:hypothetical protein